MPENAPVSNAAAGYLDGLKWIVGLAGAVFTGVFLHPEWITQRPEKMRIYIAGVLFLFGISIISGVVYLLWINWVLRAKEKLAEVESVHIALGVTADRGEKKNPTEETPIETRNRIKKGLKKAQTRMNAWFLVLKISFFLAASLGVVAFCVWIANPGKSTVEVKKPAAVVPLRFTITQSAVHKTKKGMEAHTFLLNQQTGEVWQMVCDGPSGAVSFRRVPWLDLNNRPEKGEVGLKP